MSTLTDAEQQTLILALVGDDDQGTVAAVLPILWKQTAGATSDDQRRLQTQLLAVDVLLARVRGRVSFRTADGTQVTEAQLTENLQTMRRNVLDDLARLQQVESGPVIGDLSTTAPVEPPDGSFVDANDRAYRGDPYRPPMSSRRRFTP